MSDPVCERETIETEGDDLSVEYLFGWETIDQISIPVIPRGDEQFVAARIADSKLFDPFRGSLLPEINSCARIRCYYITEREALLLNHINQIHCDNKLGSAVFTTRDVVSDLSDIRYLYKFLKISKEIFSSGTSTIDWLGFKSISGFIVPYLVKSLDFNTRDVYVPQTPIIERVVTSSAQKIRIRHWDASYLNMLCIYAGLNFRIRKTKTFVY